MCEIPGPCFSHGIYRHFARSQLTSARFCQQICEIPSSCFSHGIYRHFARSQLTSARFCQQICEIPRLCFPRSQLTSARFCRHIYRHFARSQLTSARFCQQICETPSPCFHTVFTGIWLDHNSLPPDFASRFVKSLALVFNRYLQAFCSITAHFRQIWPADL